MRSEQVLILVGFTHVFISAYDFGPSYYKPVNVVPGPKPLCHGQAYTICPSRRKGCPANYTILAGYECPSFSAAVCCKPDKLPDNPYTEAPVVVKAPHCRSQEYSTCRFYKVGCPKGYSIHQGYRCDYAKTDVCCKRDKEYGTAASLVRTTKSMKRSWL